MKKLTCLTLIVLFAVILGACNKATPQSSKEMINPGDRIGDFLITTGKEGEVTYTWELDCPQQGEGENYTCKVAVGTRSTCKPLAPLMLPTQSLGRCVTGTW
jgi:hypothetical protein